MVDNAKVHIFILLILTILLSLIPDAKAQDAPITTAATVGGAIPGTITVPITAINFDNIGAISLSLDYDYSVLHFIQGTPNPQIPSFTVLDNNLGTGYHRLIMAWFGPGQSLSDGSTIMTITFTYISGISTLGWYDNGSSCEYADANFNVLNDIPQATYYINGYVCGTPGNPGPIAGSTAVCQGQTGVNYSIAPVLNATSYFWAVPPGATIVTGSNTNSITVDFSINAVSGNVTVNGVNVCGNGPTAQLPVTVNELPVADAGNDIVIPYGTWTTLYAASGGTGSFSYHWSPESLLVNPDLQNPQTVQLTNTTIFTLVVTNQVTLCQNSDEMIVTITGGPLSVSPGAIPNSICSGQVVQLYSNAGGGSGNYTYLWTSNPPGTPPWYSTLANPLVYPDISKQYLVTVSDGYNSASGSTYVTVNPLPTATISGGDSLCDDGSTATLTVDLNGTPPWSFIYSDGVNAFVVADQMTTPYLIITSDPGTYTILAVEDVFCTGTTYGSAIVVVSPLPATPVITQVGEELHSNLCCGNQWYLNGYPVPGATGQTFTPAMIGTYFDIVTLNGCSSDTSNIITITIIHIDQKKSEHTWLYPNPARERIKFIIPPGVSRQYRIQFINVYGVKVKEFFIDFSKPEKEKDLDIEDISPGLYLIMIEDQIKTYITKLMIE